VAVATLPYHACTPDVLWERFQAEELPIITPYRLRRADSRGKRCSPGGENEHYPEVPLAPQGPDYDDFGETRYGAMGLVDTEHHRTHYFGWKRNAARRTRRRQRLHR
jgi:hypothetical protein